MKHPAKTILISFIAATVFIVVGTLLAVPVVFAGRVLPGVKVGGIYLVGLSKADVAGVFDKYQETLQKQELTVTLRGLAVSKTLGELGLSLNVSVATEIAMTRQPNFALTDLLTRPDVLNIDVTKLHESVSDNFSDVIDVPTNATLFLTKSGALALSPGASGEGIDTLTLENDIAARVSRDNLQQPVELVVVSAAPDVLDGEVESAQRYAATLFREGFKLTFEDQTFNMRPSTVRRLLQFTPTVDPSDSANKILGVKFDSEALALYLKKTIAPQVEQEALDARFERATFDRVQVFQQAQQGRSLSLDKTAQNAAASLAHAQVFSPLAVEVTEPVLASVDDVEELGITDLLASGKSDFKGSPNNRVHNVKVGASRYHGLLIAPGQNFSFNEQLGPVDGAHGWKPELVIKNNTTIPEFGGGICQVSTTAFRAALQSGLVIDERRNHSYAVSYYGVPGFDATVYPGYTDLRFTNNTPSYILIQTRVEGTNLIFDFWGTDDGREVEVDGPHPYARQSDGAVKATLSQLVKRDGEVIQEDSFYSSYKSPKLYPKVLSIDDPKAAANSKPSPSPSPKAKNST